MKSVSELSKFEGRVYVYLSSPEICNRFFEEAETEGFSFSDGVKPSQKHTANLIAVNQNKTLNYVGTNGRIAYGSGVKKIGNDELLRVDYAKYIFDDN